MKIMITGLSGNLSSALVKAFPENEFKFDSKDCTFSKTEVPFTYDVKYKKELDIRNRKKIDKYMQYKPDIIIHTAAYVNTNRCEEDTIGAFPAVCAFQEKARTEAVALKTAAEDLLASEKAEAILESDAVKSLKDAVRDGLIYFQYFYLGIYL